MSLICNQDKSSNLKDDLMLQKKSYNNRRCNIKNRIGLITPQMTDDFISLHKRIELEKSSTTNTNENKTNKNSSKDFCIKTAELCTKKIISDSYEFEKKAKEKWNLSKRETKDLYDSCKEYYKINNKWPDGHVTIKRVVRIEDIPNDILDMLIKDGISSFSLELNERMNVPISEVIELANECEAYYSKNGHWPDGHVTDFKIKK